MADQIGSDFLQTGLALLQNGYNIVPIRAGYKYPMGVTNWESIVATPEQVEAWAQDGGYSGYGIRDERIAGIDVDVDNETIAKAWHEYAISTYPGIDRVCRVGRFPRHLFATANPHGLRYRASAGFIDPADRARPDGKPKIQRMELLTGTKQWVAVGDHPDIGKPYRYTNETVLDVPAEDLFVITPAIIDDLEQYLEKLCVEAGWEAYVEGRAGGGERIENDLEFQVKATQPCSFTLEQIQADLDVYREYSYDRWLDVGRALWHQFQGGPEGLDLWDQWSQHSVDYNYREMEYKYPTLKPKRHLPVMTFASIHQRAEAARKKAVNEDIFDRQEKAAESRKIFSAADLKGPPPPVVCTWDGYFEVEEVNLLYADGAKGKTQFMLQHGMCMSAGIPFMGRDVLKGKTLFISCEDTRKNLHRRVYRTLPQYMLSLEDVRDLEFHTPDDAESEEEISAMNSMLMLFENGIGKATPFLKWVEKECRERGTKQLTIDTVADVFGGNEIVKSEVRGFIRTLTSLARRLEMAVVILAHPSKSGMREGSGTSGNVGWNNSARSRLYMTDDDTNPDVIVLKHMKRNNGPMQPDLLLGNFSGVIRNLTPEEVEDIGQTEAVREQFLELLRIHEQRGQRVGDSTRGNYAPRVFFAEQRHHHGMPRYSEDQYAEAMGYLIANGVVEVAEDRRNRARFLVSDGR